MEKGKIDENLYSRQIGAFGLETVVQLARLNILISGLGGTGVETAKNLILQGPRSVSLHDDSLVQLRDLNSVYCFTTAHVENGVSKSAACVASLASLNSYVKVLQHSGSILSEQYIHSFDVIVVCNASLKHALLLNKFCRSKVSQAVGFIGLNTLGLAASIFVDFGDNFFTKDPNGVEPKELIVAGALSDKVTTIFTHTDKKVPFTNGEFVEFSEVEGAVELNYLPPQPIKITGPYSFEIPYTPFKTAYVNGGKCKQVKMSEKMHFTDLENSICAPIPTSIGMLPSPDLSKIGFYSNLHVAFQVLLLYKQRHQATDHIDVSAAHNTCVPIYPSGAPKNSVGDIIANTNPLGDISINKNSVGDIITNTNSVEGTIINNSHMGNNITNNNHMEEKISTHVLMRETISTNVHTKETISTNVLTKETISTNVLMGETISTNIPMCDKFSTNVSMDDKVSSNMSSKIPTTYCVPPREITAVIVQECKEICAEYLRRCRTYESRTEHYSRIELDEIDPKLILNLLKYHSCELPMFSSFMGGLAAQEIVKFTHKYTPISGYIYFDCFNMLPPTDLPPSSTASQHSRYDSLIQVMGREFQEKLATCNVFVVGAGALGCEMMKNLALLGIGSKGKITITDMDHIELSNLNRQFLFRQEHIGKPKSTTAAESCRRINPDVQVEALTRKVGVETEHVFTQDFWESQSFVVNALDNIPARQYVDGKCVWHCRALFESGTLGTNGNVQVIVPYVSQSYSESSDPAEEHIPLCTLKHFPYLINHTIEWGLNSFQEQFTDNVHNCMKVLDNVGEFLMEKKKESTSDDQIVAALKPVLHLLELAQIFHSTGCSPTELSPTFWHKCVQMSVDLYCEYFVNQPKQLLLNFPADHRTSEGDLFWSGTKRAPQVRDLDIGYPICYDFIHACINMLASFFSTARLHEASMIVQLVQTSSIPTFQPQQMKVEIEGSSGKTGHVGMFKGELQDKSNELYTHEIAIKKLAVECAGCSLSAAEFEKDDETNFHIDYIHAVAMLRADNYSIQHCSKLKTKMVAGKIIPAIASTTSLICGFVTQQILMHMSTTGGPVQAELAPHLRKHPGDILVNMEDAQLMETVVQTANARAALPQSLLCPLPWKRTRCIELYRDIYVALGICEFIISEPAESKKNTTCFNPIMNCEEKAIPEGFTIWFKQMLHLPNGTVRDLCDHLKNSMGVEVDILSIGHICIYNSLVGTQKKERYDKKIMDLYLQFYGESAKFAMQNSNCIALEASCVDIQGGEEANIPTIQLYFK